MSARAKRPTDDPERTEVYEPGTKTPVTTVDDPRRRGHKPTNKGVAGGPVIETPTDLAPPPDMVDVALAQRSEPIRAISMKQAGGVEQPKAQRRDLHVQLRAMSDMKRPETPSDLGRLAPPRDPREVRARRLRDLVIWACVAIILACGVTLVIWFAARR